ncbi:MAG: hypothetical protein RIC55_07420 [Pirellulaceae bacterium]
MTINTTSFHSIRRIFTEGFTVNDIAEPLASFDDCTPAPQVRAFMQQRRYQLLGIRRDGVVTHYVERDQLGDGPCAEYMRPIPDERRITDTTPLVQAVLRLKEHSRLFVSLLGRVGGIVSRSDLQKPPVRMWLFGMITLIEMRFTRLIAAHCPDESWREFLSPARIEKAETLLAERIRHHQDLPLLECLQLADKVQIIARNEKLRAMTVFQSRRQIEQAQKMIERLRNNLAHSQDILTTDWDTIVLLSENLDVVVDGPRGMRAEAD